MAISHPHCRRAPRRRPGPRRNPRSVHGLSACPSPPSAPRLVSEVDPKRRQWRAASSSLCRWRGGGGGDGCRRAAGRRRSPPMELARRWWGGQLEEGDEPAPMDLATGLEGGDGAGNCKEAHGGAGRAEKRGDEEEMTERGGAMGRG
ncbi:hypothetical protein U9M48_018456 [Paspalum notatum var. saurae]|uniref:Uncharacterized protein n=1 Tax=Paspalum notatum var. saurae TaxID=547442 RepID=A0AAQ3WQJ0_PASNO